jgi:hypothetical protein
MNLVLTINLNLLHKRLGGHTTWRYVDYPRFYPPQNVPMAQETTLMLEIVNENENGFARAFWRCRGGHYRRMTGGTPPLW